MHQKTEPGACHGHAETGDGWIAGVAPEHELDRHAHEDEGAAAAGQTIESVGEIGGVAFGQKNEQSQRPDHQAQWQGDPEGQ